MTRGLLDESVLAGVDARLPQVLQSRDIARSLMPDLLSAQFDPGSYIPIASVCFQDCTETMVGVRIALFEYLAHGKYYREVREPVLEPTAILFERFFLDDASFRLYSAGEHLPNAVVFMLNLSDADLAPYRLKRTSQQSIVAAYLRRKLPNSPVTKDLLVLGSSVEWQFTMTYRAQIVHDQPPSIKGLRLSYRRRLRWIVSADKTKKRLEFVGGDPPEYDIAIVAKHILGANEMFVTAVADTLEEYFKVLEQYGIQRDTDGLTPDRRK